MTFASHQNVKKYQLPNGLDVLLEVNKAMPVVSLNVGVKVGSVWETEKEAGLSHVLEHMVFKGTKSYGPGEIATIVESSGGELNAYTSLDQTVYFINLSSRYTDLGLNLIKEMVFDAKIDAAELAREKEVILEELRRGKDNPHKMLSEATFSLVYQKHPYGRPVIGYEETIQNFGHDFVFDFYKRWYSPSNMVLGICGDFEEKQMRETILKEFGSIPSSKVIRPEIPEEPLPTKPRQVLLSNPIEGNYLHYAFPIPHFKHPDIPALDLLSHVLGEGDTSRLEQIVKEKKGLVNSVHSYAFTPRFPGLFVIDAQIPPQKVEKVLPAVIEEVNYLKENLVSTENLDRGKLSIKSSIFYEKETCEGTARKWILYETIADDFGFEAQYMDAIDSVSEHDIRRVANDYLSSDRSSIALLHPEGQKVKISLPKKITKNKKTKRKKPYKLVETVGDIQKFRLDNGIAVITRENHRVPLIAFKHACYGGLRYETPKTNGISQLMASLLGKGTKTKSALKIAEICESIAGHVGGYSARNSWGVSAGCLAQKMESGVDLFCDVLMNPAFTEKEFKKEKRFILEAIKNKQDELAHIAFEKLQETLFKKHPYGMSLLGTEKSIRSLSQGQIHKFYRHLINPKQMVITAVGDFKTTTLLDTLTDRLLQIKQTKKTKLKLKPEKPPTNIQKSEIKKEKMQAHVALGFLGTTVHSEDRYALEVLNNILSGQGGRLFLELRDKQSLAYTVTSLMIEGIEPGFFAVYMGTEPRKVPVAIEGILKELNKVRSDRVSQEELDRAKNYIVGNYDIDLQRNSAVASTLAFNELYDIELSEFNDYPKRILKITSNEVLEVARKYLKLDAYILVVVKP